MLNRFFILLIGIAFVGSVNGQIYHTNPYQIRLISLNIEQTKEEVIQYKIKEVSSLYSYVKKDGSRKKKAKLIYTVEFDSLGNPTHYKSKHVMVCWWWPTLLQNLKLQKKSSEIYDYHFQYDNKNNLIKVSETLVESNYPSSSKKDVYNFYDKENRLIKQKVSDKTIYQSGYKYAGSTYENDTTIFNYHFNYNENGNVNTVIEMSEKMERGRNVIISDTLKFNCSFDSIFIVKEIPKGVGCSYSLDSSNNRVKKFIYNDEGKIIKAESYLKTGEIVGEEKWEYDNNNLIKSIYNVNAEQIIYYKYKYY